MEIYIPPGMKIWVEGGEVSAYVDDVGIVVEDWSGVSHVDGSAWIETTMHLLEASGELEANELCRVRDGLAMMIPHGYDPTEQYRVGVDIELEADPDSFDDFTSGLDLLRREEDNDSDDSSLDSGPNDSSTAVFDMEDELGFNPFDPSEPLDREAIHDLIDDVLDDVEENNFPGPYDDSDGANIEIDDESVDDTDDEVDEE